MSANREKHSFNNAVNMVLAVLHTVSRKQVLCCTAFPITLRVVLVGVACLQKIPMSLYSPNCVD